MHNVCFAVLLVASVSSAATPVQGTLSGNPTWTVSGSPYHLTGDVTVPSGSTLTIQPGVMVTAAASDGLAGGTDSSKVELIVNGTLKVNGTTANPVTFTTNGNKGDWYGLNIKSSSSSNVIAGAQIEKAYRGITTSGPVTMTDSLVQNSVDSCFTQFGSTSSLSGNTLSGCGVDAVYSSSSSTLTMNNNLVTSTGTFIGAIRLHGVATLDHNTLADNGWGGILLDSASAITLKNNIVVNNASYGIRRSGTGSLTYQNNNVWGHTTDLDGTISGTGNLSVDPKFVGPGNYRLQASSPCRGAGTSASDMGAFPYSGAIQRVEITPSSASVAAGGTVQLSAQAFDANNVAVPTPFTWTASAAAGTINSAGLLTAGCTPGTIPSAITASAGGKSASAQVVITVGPLATLNLQPAGPTLPAGGTQQFSAQGADSCGNPVSATASWSASNGAGSISASGLFTATLTPGTYSGAVTASAGGVSKSTSVTITTGAVANITVSPANISLAPGAQHTFTAVAKDAAGNTVNTPLTWSVGGGGTISPSGVFTAGTSAGTFANTVTATAGGISGKATVTVQAGPAAKLVISPNTATLAPAGTTTFSAQVFDAYNNLTADSVTWSVLTSAAGTITPGGVFTAGNTPGSYLSSVRAAAGTASATANVTIQTGALAQLILTPAQATVRAGATVAFAASGKDAAGNPVAVTPSWKVLQGGGTIDAQGVFNAGTMPGQFTDTVQAEVNGVAATSSVEVTPGPVAQVAVTPIYPELGEGQTQQFTATAKDVHGNEVTQVDWTWSADSRAGSVDGTGLFTAGTLSGDYPNAVSATAEGLTGSASIRVLPSMHMAIDAGTVEPLFGRDGGGYEAVNATGTGCGCTQLPAAFAPWGLLLLGAALCRRRSSTHPTRVGRAGSGFRPDPRG